MDYRWKVTNTGRRSPGTRVPMVAQILQRNADVVKSMLPSAAAQPSNVRNSRRFNLSKCIRSPLARGGLQDTELARIMPVPVARNEAGWQGGRRSEREIIVEDTKIRACGREILKNEALSVLLHARLFV